MKNAAIIVLIAFLFIYDLTTPLGSGTSLMYLIPFALLGLYPQKKFSIAFGIIITFLVVVGYFLNPPGGIRGTGEINRTITVLAGWGILILLIQRRKIFGELAGANARLTAVFDSSPMAIIALDPEGSVLDWNRAAQEIFGYRLEEVSGHLYPIVPEEDTAAFKEKFATILEGESIKNMELSRRRKDGEILQVMLSMTPLRDAEGRVFGALGTLADLTEKKRAEAKINELNDRLLKLVEESIAGIFVYGKDEFQYVNRRFPELLGYSKDEFIRTKPQFVHPEDRKRATEIFLKLLSGELEEAKLELKAVCKSRDPCYIDVLALRTEYMGSPAIIGTAIDITARKELEQEREDFAAMVTHDLKSPLTAIAGFTGLFLNENFEVKAGEAQEMHRIIKHNCERMTGMIEDYITVYKAKSGKLQIRAMSQPVADILKELEKDFSGQAEKKGLKLQLEFKSSPSAEVDKKQLTRAVSNLIQNAINYTQTGGTVKVLLDSSEKDFTISVSDTGPGIQPEEREKIFQKHYRSHGVARVKGAGLGLAIVKTIAEAHKGSVTLESEPGKGSTFSLILPLRQEGP